MAMQAASLIILLTIARSSRCFSLLSVLRESITKLSDVRGFSSYKDVQLTIKGNAISATRTQDRFLIRFISCKVEYHCGMVRF